MKPKLDTKEQKAKETIKELYQSLTEVTQINTPDFYIMPVSVYNAIINKLGHLEDYLREARKSRDYWKKDYLELKAKRGKDDRVRERKSKS